MAKSWHLEVTIANKMQVYGHMIKQNLALCSYIIEFIKLVGENQ